MKKKDEDALAVVFDLGLFGAFMWSRSAEGSVYDEIPTIDEPGGPIAPAPGDQNIEGGTVAGLTWQIWSDDPGAESHSYHLTIRDGSRLIVHRAPSSFCDHLGCDPAEALDPSDRAAARAHAIARKNDELAALGVSA